MESLIPGGFCRGERTEVNVRGPQQGKVASPAFRGRIGRRLVLTFVAFVMVVVGGTGWVLYSLTRRSLERQMSERLLAVAQLVAEGIDGDAVSWLQPGYEGGRLYKRLTNRLRRARDMVDARRIYVFDRQGRSLLDTKPDVPIGREYVRLRIDRSELDSVWVGKPAHSLRFQGEDGVEYKSGYAPIHAGEEVVGGVGVDIGAGFLDAIRAFGQSVLILGSISAVLTVAIGLGLARTLTRPTYRLVRAAQAIGRGNLDQPVAPSSRDELGYLGETMEEMRRKILARDEQLRQMLAGVAHEICNPLGGIEIYAGLIAGDLPDGDPRKVHIQKVIGEVKTLKRVISEFMDFARPAPPSPTPVGVAQLAEEVAFLLAPEMEGTEVRCVREIPEDLQAYVDVDQFKRVLINLMVNGVQAMPEGGTLTMRACRARPGVEIAVADTGSGMSAEVMGRLFEPFFTTREKGAGLGLAIVQKVVEENGGRVEVENEPGVGTVFRVVVPEYEGSKG